MGGTITVVIKNKDKIYKMARWTNSLPFYIQNQNFFNKSEDHLKEYLSQWEKMEKDYNDKKVIGKNTGSNMADVYIPLSGVIAPTEYGIIYIDYDKNLLLSCQSYTDLKRIHLCSMFLNFNQGKNGHHDSEIFFKNMADLRPKFTDMNAYNSNGEIIKSVYSYILDSKDLNKEFSLLKSKEQTLNDPAFFSSYINLDVSPFTFKSFPDTAIGFKKIYKEIKKLVKLSPNEENLWKSYIKDRFDS